MTGLVVTELSEAQIRERLDWIEHKVPRIKAAFESESNHGDSCWHAEVDWHPLATEYDSLRWLLKAKS